MSAQPPTHAPTRSLNNKPLVPCPPSLAGPDALTFEAWLSTSDYCHASALFSYALPSTAEDPRQRTADFNSFVIFDPARLVACHDYEYM
jgi:hypothetical protein